MKTEYNFLMLSSRRNPYAGQLNAARHNTPAESARLMSIPAHVSAFWSEYVADMGGISEERFYEAFSFGDSAQMADELGALVVSGVKQATASALWSYQASGKALPQPGQLSIVTDSADRPLCIIETVQVDTVPFSEVTAEFAAAEGEGDGSLAFWRLAHRAFFGRECDAIGKTFSEDMPVVCERFQVVFIRGDN